VSSDAAFSIALLVFLIVLAVVIYRLVWLVVCASAWRGRSLEAQIRLRASTPPAANRPAIRMGARQYRQITECSPEKEGPHSGYESGGPKEPRRCCT